MANTCKKEDKRCHREFKIKNLSNGSIIRALNMQNTSNKCNLSGSVIKPNEYYIMDRRSCWEDILAKNAKLEIYIVDTSLFNSPNVYYDCDSIEIKNKVLKHYVLTLEDLQKNNFVITYP